MITRISNQHSIIGLVLLTISMVVLFSVLAPNRLSDGSNQPAGVDASFSIAKSNLRLTAEQLQLESELTELHNSFFNLGDSHYADIRIEPEISNTHRTEQKLIVVERNNIFTPVHLFYFDGKQWQEVLFAEVTRDRKLLSTVIPKQAVGSAIYIRLTGKYLRGHISIAEQNEFNDALKVSGMVSGMYYGAAVLFIALSFIMAKLTASRAYAAYGALLLVCLVWIASGEGWLTTFFPEAAGIAFLTSNALGLLFVISFASFTRHYLMLKVLNEFTDRCLYAGQIFIFMVWVLFCLTFDKVADNLYQVFYTITLLVALSVFFIALYGAKVSVQNGRQQAIYYLLTLCVFVVTGTASALTISGNIAWDFSWPAVQLASAMEIILLATGFLVWHRQKMQELQDIDVAFRRVNIDLEQARTAIEDLKENMQSNLVSPLFAPEIAKVVSLLPTMLYIKASGNYAIVCAPKRAEIEEVLIDCTLQSIADAIGEQKLLRCHKSYLVPVSKDFKLVRRSSADFDLVLDEATVPVGRKYRSIVQAHFGKIKK